jgi:lambda repressor-like predicted transcriptional regulator
LMGRFDPTASCVLDRFAEHLPHKPYCTDDLTAGLQIRSLKTALQRAYIQHNHPGMIWAMVYDVDRACVNPTDWWPIWESVGLPPPNMAVMNYRTKRGHLIYLLEAGVCRTELAHLKPLRYIASIERVYTAVLGADPGYAGLICKNPFNDRWQVWEIHGNPYTLDDLAAYVDLTAKAARLPSDASESFGLGRNCTMFDDGRFWAYGAVRAYWAPNGLGRWSKAVLERLQAINGEFPQPLPFAEVKATAKSISGWTWRNMTPAGLQDLIERTHTPEQQAERGRKATNQADIAAMGGIASGQARKLSREQDRATARLMKAQGLSLREIAKTIGVSHESVRTWCAGC